MRLSGNLVDVRARDVYPATVEFENGKITGIHREEKEYDAFLLPGLIDGHIHIESSMLCPSRFAEAAVPHGTTAVVTDPHEIANVLGLDGVRYMMDDASSVPLKVCFTAPSCVPATPFETSGAVLGVEEVAELLAMPGVVALGEMMNFPGVVSDVPDVLAKLDAAKSAGKPIDGHAPLLSGEQLERYVAAGISTDHECTTVQEAREKLALGMRIQVREGSASKNLGELWPLLCEEGTMLVSDDKHSDDLLAGHMDEMIREAIEFGAEPLDALRAATLAPAEHYGLDGGWLEVGRAADIIVVDDMEKLNIERVFIDGVEAARSGRPLFSASPSSPGSSVDIGLIRPGDLEIRCDEDSPKVEARVIDVLENQLLTREGRAPLDVMDRVVQPDLEGDILGIAVVERYGHGNVGLGFVRGFGLREGALAQTVAHDSHNIVCVGTSAEEMHRAIMAVAEVGGGIAAVSSAGKEVLRLPVAGLMSTEPAGTVAEGISRLEKMARGMGCILASPFMTMSFLALLVIPELKLSDKGLFDGRSFTFTDVIAGGRD